jgi:hypothetical protein
MIPPTSGRKGGVMLRIDFMIAIATAGAHQEKEEPSLEKGRGWPYNMNQHPWDQMHVGA